MSWRASLCHGESHCCRIQDKDVKVKLRIQAEGVFYELETEAETEYVQKFVAKLLVRGCAVCPARDH